jgi:hypothetical protein
LPSEVQFRSPQKTSGDPAPLFSALRDISKHHPSLV